ncbi:hypothetical protein Ahy_B05g076480 [Arachis hypogaea]|uniref:Ubiquitin-like protease family profile domain-containing protein n=1 Tax=Arachis hypogaea TaxID=3818 RepID=A0A444Z3A0_ARAHY|nr:hypothetical protein Ahy_B05g076480 [Arachis hypogaea]
MIDARVATALKFAGKTSSEPSFTAAEGYKNLEKEKEITKELKEKCYHLMTHGKETKDSTNECDTIFIFNHEAYLEGLRHHFLSLRPGEDVVNAQCMILNDRKCHQFQEEIYCVPTEIVLFVLICNGRHWWLWIADVQKKAFYVLDPVNKKKDQISDLRIKLKKFVTMNRVRFIVVGDLHSLYP